MATMLSPTSDLVLVRHELRMKRLQEIMLAPRVAPPQPDHGSIRCPQCGTARAPYSMCRICHPRRNQPKRSPEAGYKRGATALGISVDEYRRHREDGERWCSFHKRWEPLEAFATRNERSGGLRGYCYDRMPVVVTP